MDAEARETQYTLGLHASCKSTDAAGNANAAECRYEELWVRGKCTGTGNRLTGGTMGGGFQGVG